MKLFPRFIFSFFSIIIMGFGFGCSKKIHLTYKPAPVNEQELGYIVQGDLKDIEEFSAKNNITGRMLNSEIGLVELYTRDQETIKRQLPKAKVAKNVFVSLKPSIYDETLSSEELSKKLSTQRDYSQLIKFLDSCKPSPLSPTPKIDVAQQITKRIQINSDETITISSRYSTPNLAYPKDTLQSEWQIYSPSSSNMILQEPLVGSEYEFKPDSLGAYIIFLKISDSLKNCSYGRLVVLVTENAKLEVVNESKPLTDDEFKSFTHLFMIDADKAIQKSKTAGKNVTIAIVDSGVDYNNPDLNSNIIINPNEIPNNQLDDDGNGLPDDVIGWDFANNDAFPFDDTSHGTHVAGLSGSRVVGLAPKAHILSVKVLNAAGSGDFGSVMAGLLYATQRGAKVINMSLGSATDPQGIEFIMKEFKSTFELIDKNGSLIVAAAGNGDEIGNGMDNDLYPQLPASLPIENLITVAALGFNSQLAPFSNFGKEGVDVAAPGGDNGKGIKSCYLKNPNGERFIEMSGTSMAAPIVSGLVALIWSENQNLDPKQIKRVILESGNNLDSLKNKLVSGKLINALQAIEMVNQL